MKITVCSTAILFLHCASLCSSASMKVVSGNLSEEDLRHLLRGRAGDGEMDRAMSYPTDNQQDRNLEDEFKGLDCIAESTTEKNEKTGERVETYPPGCACRDFGVTTYTSKNALSEDNTSSKKSKSRLSKKSKKFSKTLDEADSVYMSSTLFVNDKTGKEAHVKAKLGYYIEDIVDNGDNTLTITDVGEQLFYYWYHGDISSANRDEIPHQGPFIMFVEKGKVVSMQKDCSSDDEAAWNCAYSELISVEGKIVMYCDELA